MKDFFLHLKLDLTHLKQLSIDNTEPTVFWLLNLACLWVLDLHLYVMTTITVCEVQIMVFGLFATLLTGFLLRGLESRREIIGKREQ